MATNHTLADAMYGPDGPRPAVRARARRPAPGRDPAAHARAMARIVTPLIADALALRGRLAQCRAADPGTAPPGAAEGAASLLAVFADQLLASAELLAECVRGLGGAAQIEGPDALGPAPSTARAFRRGAVGPDVRDPDVPSLLADEGQVARRLRRAIAACDARGDDRTADRLEEVLDEIERQRWFLADFFSPVPE